MQMETLIIHQAVVSGQGEDSFAVSKIGNRLLLCAADGCGGLGSKRYACGSTGARIASRTAAETIQGWERITDIPPDGDAARFWLDELQFLLDNAFRQKAEEHCKEDSPSRIVGSMQRTLPTTVCAFSADNTSGCGAFFWAGDSRGYTLDAEGLHQYTRDDARGNPDAYEGLLLDRPLTNFVSADRGSHLSGCGLSLPEKGLLLCATDGVYHLASSPMELEMLLLDTLLHARSMAGWQKQLEKRLCPHLQDDTTLLCQPRGFSSFREMQQYFRPRCRLLKDEYIKPIQRRNHGQETVRSLWQRYRIGYDRTEGTAHERTNWRV